MEFTAAQIRVAKRLFELGAVKFGAFKLKLHEKNPDAPLSPIYLNLRTPDNPKAGPLTPDEVQACSAAMVELLLARNLSFEAVAGVPRAGDPFANSLARQMTKTGQMVGLLVLDKSEDGDKRLVTSIREGAYGPGFVALVVDDLITRADSKLEAIRVLESSGLRVTDVLVLVDRGQGGGKELERFGYRLHAVFTLRELLDFYVDTGLLAVTKRDEVLAYLTANS
jgi:uridine monophosphate synthetase